MAKPVTSQTVISAAMVAAVKPVTSGVVILTATGIDARGVRVSQQPTLAAVVNGPQMTLKTSSIAVLVAYRTGSSENLTNRSWTFSLDGHTFYVLTVGEQGTFVYDLTTREWAQWKTTGLNTWNMEIGTTWKGKIVAADQQNPTVWQLTPLSFIDDGFKTITRVVTGGLFMRQRMQVPNYSFSITASLGVPEIPITFPVTVPTVKLEFSDDQGKTFTDAGTLTLTTGLFTQQLRWLSLGTMQAPLRVFRLTDIGAIARIDGADAETDEDEDRQ